MPALWSRCLLYKHPWKDCAAWRVVKQICRNTKDPMENDILIERFELNSSFFLWQILTLYWFNGKLFALNNLYHNVCCSSSRVIIWSRFRALPTFNNEELNDLIQTLAETLRQSKYSHVQRWVLIYWTK